MKKSTFRINLFKGSNSLCETLVLMAAKSNGANDKNKIQLPILTQCGKFMNMDEDVSVEQIDENLLHIDRKIGEDWVTVCSVERIEVFEVSTPIFEDADDIPQDTFQSVAIGDN